MLDIEGGEATRATDAVHRHGVQAFDWHPDGRRPGGAGRGRRAPGTRRRAYSGEPTARVIRRLDWRYDGAGLTLQPRHLHVVPRAGGAPRRLTSGPWSAGQPRDRARRRHRRVPGRPRPRRRPSRRAPASTWCRIDGGEPRRLAEPAGHVAAIAYEADGGAAGRARERFPHDDDDARPALPGRNVRRRRSCSSRSSTTSSAARPTPTCSTGRPTREPADPRHDRRRRRPDAAGARRRGAARPRARPRGGRAGRGGGSHRRRRLHRAAAARGLRDRARAARGR